MFIISFKEAGLMKQNEKIRNWIVLITIAILTLLLFQLMWGEGGGLFGSLNFTPKYARPLADGFWGWLGFYENPADNAITYVLIGLAVISAVFRFRSRYADKPRRR